MFTRITKTQQRCSQRYKLLTKRQQRYSKRTTQRKTQTCLKETTWDLSIWATH